MPLQESWSLKSWSLASVFRIWQLREFCSFSWGSLVYPWGVVLFTAVQIEHKFPRTDQSLLYPVSTQSLQRLENQAHPSYSLVFIQTIPQFFPFMVIIFSSGWRIATCHLCPKNMWKTWHVQKQKDPHSFNFASKYWHWICKSKCNLCYFSLQSIIAI